MTDISDTPWPPRDARPTGGATAAAPPVNGRAASSGAERLSRVVEAEIIPRLMLVARINAPNGGAGTADVPADDVDALVAHATRRDLAGALELIETLRARAVADETICLDLITPAARELGRMWDEDEIDFAQSTMALFTLHALVRHIGAGATEVATVGGPGAGRRVLLGMACGDQHTLGVALVAEFLRRAGWDVWQETSVDAGGLQRLVGEEWFDAVGLSVSRLEECARLSAEVRALKAASCNRTLRVVIGGQVYRDDPDIAAHVGADAAAGDAREAVAVLASIVEAASGRC